MKSSFPHETDGHHNGGKQQKISLKRDQVPVDKVNLPAWNKIRRVEIVIYTEGKT